MAYKIPLRRQQTGDRQLDDFQRLAQEVAQRANDCPFFTGVLASKVSFLAEVDTLVTHGLGRKPKGYFVTRDYGPADYGIGVGLCFNLTEAASQPTDLTKQIRLNSYTDCTVDIWFF